MSWNILARWSLGCFLGAAVTVGSAAAQGRTDEFDDTRVERRRGFQEEDEDRADPRQRRQSEERASSRRLRSDDQEADSREQQRASRRRGEGAARDAGLGVSLSPGDEAVIEEIVSDSPAERAGLQPGDEIIRLDGQPVESASALVEEIRGKQPGGWVELEIRRDGRRRDVEVRLASREEALSDDEPGQSETRERTRPREDQRTDRQQRRRSEAEAQEAGNESELARQIQRLQRRLDRLERELQEMRAEHRSLISRRRAADDRRELDSSSSSRQEDRSDMRDFDDDWAEEEMVGDDRQPPTEEEFGPEEEF